jgi:hypothetical protein
MCHQVSTHSCSFLQYPNQTKSLWNWARDGFFQKDDVQVDTDTERERELYLAGGVQKGWQPVAQSPEKQTSSHEWSQWWPYLAAVEAAVAFVAGPVLLSRRSFFLLHHHSCHQFSSHSLISPFLVHPATADKQKKRSEHFVSHQRKEGSKQPTSSYTGKCTGKKERRAKNPENQLGRDQRVELQEWRHWGKHCSTTAIACTPMPSWVPAAAAAAASSSSPAAAAAVVADVGGDWLALPPPGGWKHRPPPLPPKGSAALPSSLSLVPWF